MVTVCWFVYFWCYYDLVKCVKFVYFLENPLRKWLEISHSDVSWSPQKWLDFGHSLLILLILVLFWLSEMGQIWGFRPFWSCSVVLAATKQLYEWSCPSVRPSVRPSVTPVSLCSWYRIIMKFSGVITIDKSDVRAKGQGQRSKVKVTEVKTQLSRLRTVTPLWIHIRQRNHIYCLK